MSIEEHAKLVWKYFTSIDKGVYGIEYPSIPVPYFGNYDDYQKSHLKIITVGLNPSNKELPDENPFGRFYKAEKIYKHRKLGRRDLSTYLNSLNNYFDYNSNSWFDNFEPILNAMNASFHSGYQNVALHTDFFTPLITTDSWSKYKKSLSSSQFDELTKKGTELWHKLVDILQPDIILASLGESNCQQILDGYLLSWKKFAVFDKTAKGEPRKKPFEVDCAVARLPSGKKCLLVSGMVGVVPFMITGEQKADLGSKLYSLITGNLNVKYEMPQLEKSDPRELLSTLYGSRNTQ